VRYQESRDSSEIEERFLHSMNRPIPRKESEKQKRRFIPVEMTGCRLIGRTADSTADRRNRRRAASRHGGQAESRPYNNLYRIAVRGVVDIEEAGLKSWPYTR
jgi:hypothetical protein